MHFENIRFQTSIQCQVHKEYELIVSRAALPFSGLRLNVILIIVYGFRMGRGFWQLAFAFN